MYLDEQPVTTIDGISTFISTTSQRIEVLPGPQGTLYGASSEAGTIRIITNKPDPNGFAAGYDLEGNTVDHGGHGLHGRRFRECAAVANAAVRLVAWDEHKAGFIDNRARHAYVFPTSGIFTFNNAPFVKKDANDVDIRGRPRGAQVDLNDNWTITPTVMGQVTRTVNGNFAYNPAVGRPGDTLQFFPETDARLLGAVRAHRRGQDQRLRPRVFGRLFDAQSAR